jgi:ATP-dependent RNA helicase RhlE
MFEELSLHPALLEAIRDQGYQTPTPIQSQAIPPILEGRDLLGCAQTGTGKTAAFALPTLQRLARSPRTGRAPRVLVLVPTRELAGQVGESFVNYGGKLGVRCAVVFGGVGQGAQVAALRDGVDVLVATPGRLLDLHDQRHVALGSIEVLVLDEADRMLDMGFIRPIRQVLGLLPKRRQNLLFSATMPPEIRSLAASLLHEPAQVSVTPVASTAPLIEQQVCFVPQGDKPDALARVLSQPDIERAIVFTRTKHGADKLAKKLSRVQIAAEVIHGNKSQNARLRALANFKSGAVRVLVATDVVARGIDVEGISHVVNYDIPNEPESYVHRIGRTGRAGATGRAVSFCDETERSYLRDIERLTRKPMQVVQQLPEFGAPLPALALPASNAARAGNSGGRGSDGAGRGGQGAGRSAQGAGRSAQGAGRSAQGAAPGGQSAGRGTPSARGRSGVRPPAGPPPGRNAGRRASARPAMG